MRNKYSQSQKVIPSKISQLEQDLFAKIEGAFLDVRTQYDNPIENRQSEDILAKVRQKIDAKRQQDPKFFEEGRKKLSEQQKRKPDTFMITAVNTIQQKQQKPQKQFIQEETRDAKEMLIDLIQQESRPYDDLAELRRMIRETDQSLKEYAGDLYLFIILKYHCHKLNQNISKYNNEARKLGMGVSDAIMDKVDHKLTKYLAKSQTTQKLIIKKQ
ncbi:hypothetical protein pb186bvf_014690 [Paramecium bursaria]